MSDRMDRWIEVLDKGVSVWTAEFQLGLSLDMDSYNVTSGLRFGLGPRFGFAPIPGHQDQEVKTPPGLARAEVAAVGYLRAGILGVIPLEFASFDDVTVKRPYIAWLTATEAAGVGTGWKIDVSIGSDTNGVFGPGGTQRWKPSSDIAAGLPLPSELAAVMANYHVGSHPFAQMFPLKSGAGLSTDFPPFLGISRRYVRYASMTVSGADIPQKHVVGRIVAAPTATKTAIPNFVGYNATGVPLGVPSGFNSRKFRENLRDLVFHVMADTAVAGNPVGLNRTYNYLGQAINGTVFLSAYYQDHTAAQLDLGNATSTAGRADGVACNFASTNWVLMKDEQGVTNSGHSAILIAAEKAIACLIQDWNRNIDGSLTQWVDLTSMPLAPAVFGSYDEAEWIGGALVGTTSVRTSWNYWVPFVRGAYDIAVALNPIYQASAIAPGIGGHVFIGDNGTGVLRGGQVYEFAFSLFNKRLNFETNVGKPAKIQIPSKNGAAAIDYVYLTLFRNPTAAGLLLQKHNWIDPGNALLPNMFNGCRIPINETEYRIYYRPEGTFEWLPAGSIDAAKYWHDPTMASWTVCGGSSAGLPGGQPGGFCDYSQLPVDRYDDVLTWRGRVFWFSSKSVVFSLQNNIFAYPLRNSATCPEGVFRGGIVHAYPGQAKQEGRLIIFGTECNYIGRFTGDPAMMPVAIGLETASFPLDGSDFLIERWTTDTAFSSRAAVVAEGILYYWGPNGVFVDTGSTIPEKISDRLEPDLKKVFDTGTTDEIFAHFFPETREVWWVYNPKDTTIRTSYALVLNVRTKEFNFVRFSSKIDDIAALKIDRMGTTRKTDGARHIATVRADADAAIQRAYFFDSRCIGADLEPDREWMVKQIATVSTHVRKFTLAAGYSAARFGELAAGDLVMFRQCQDYGARTDIEDCIGVIVSTDVPTNSIDVRLPEGVSWVAAAVLAEPNYIPLWTSRHNSIPFTISSAYWTPGGLDYWAWWQYLHLQFKTELLPVAVPATLTLEHRTPISRTYLSQSFNLEDNSDGMCQRNLDLGGVDQAREGQGLKVRISGLHFGHDWVLQSILAETTRLDSNNLRHFSGD